MVDVRYLRKRGANVTVQANGSALFAPGTDVTRWRNRFSDRIQRGTIAAAPVNKRPRWDHYGPRLKSRRSIVADTRTRITKGGGFFYIMVGSTVKHAYYVDQGTGIYAGNGPYLAKVLPPYTQGGPSLYEATWRPGGPKNDKVSQVFIRGQRGQGFFDAGLAAGFRAMRMRSFKVPGEGASAITSAMTTIPAGMEGFLGNTPADAGFQKSLEQWRTWRDTAYNANMELGSGRTGTRGTRRSVKSGTRASRARNGRTRRSPAQEERRREESRKRSQRYRDAQASRKDKTKRPPKKKAGALTRSQDRARVQAAANKKFGRSNVESIEFSGGRWNVVVKTESRLASGRTAAEYKSYFFPARS